MATRTRWTQRRADALSKARIVEAAIEILDTGGESALTFRALTARLATGSRAIYWHVANKGDLLAQTTDEVIAGVMADVADGAEPREAIRAMALGLFEAIDAHPRVGAQLSRELWRSAMLQIFESLGGRLQALGVPERALFDCASALVNYVLGVAGQNAANPAFTRTGRIDRPSSRPSPHDGRSSIPRSIRSCVRWRGSCATTTTANKSLPASTSSWPGSEASDSTPAPARG